MAMQNVSAAMRMSMPEIIRQYLRTFELRQEINAMVSISALRKWPRWFPMRETLIRRQARKWLLRTSALRPASAPTNSGSGSTEVAYFPTDSRAAKQARIGTDQS